MGTFLNSIIVYIFYKERHTLTNSVNAMLGWDTTILNLQNQIYIWNNRPYFIEMKIVKLHIQIQNWIRKVLTIHLAVSWNRWLSLMC